MTEQQISIVWRIATALLQLAILTEPPDSQDDKRTRAESLRMLRRDAASILRDLSYADLAAGEATGPI